MSDGERALDLAPNPRIVQYVAEGPHLNIWCYWPTCRRRVTLTAAQAQATFGAAWDDVHKLNRIIYCSACGARAADKKVEARFCTLDHSIAEYRRRVEREIREYGEPQTQPMTIPGVGQVRAQDLGLTWTPRPRPLSPRRGQS